MIIGGARETIPAPLFVLGRQDLVVPRHEASGLFQLRRMGEMEWRAIAGKGRHPRPVEPVHAARVRGHGQDECERVAWRWPLILEGCQPEYFMMNLIESTKAPRPLLIPESPRSGRFCIH